MKQKLVALAAMAITLGACGTSNTNSSGGSQAPAHVTVFVDAKQPPGGLNLFATAYFPDTVSVHAGDTIDFKVRFTGEPHTVTFGSLVDADLAAVAKSPQAAGPGASPLPEQQKLPVLVDTSKPGPPLVNQSAAQPCFLSTGAPAASAACTADQQKSVDFDGSQTYYNSGYLPPDAVFSMKFSDSVKAGTYSYFCLLHREDMAGKVTVVDKSQSSPSADAVKAAGDAQLQTLISAMQGPTTQALAAPATKAQAGVLDMTGKIQNAGVSVFAPKEIAVPVGGTVKWLILGPHTVSFGFTAADVGGLAKGADGAVHVTAAGAPVGGTPAPQAPPPSGPPTGPPTPIAYAGGSWDGQGTHSTGLVVSFPPSIFQYSLTFTKAGTYQYRCLIHPDMEGTVKVG